MERALECKVTKAPLEFGFLNIPAKHIDSFPKVTTTTPIRVFFDSSDEAKKINFQARHRRLLGLTDWYKQNGARIGDTVSIEVIGRGEYRMKLVPGQPTRPLVSDVLNTDAAKWYRNFIDRTSTDEGGQFKGYEGGDSDKQWTRYFEHVLSRWGREEGYEVITDFGSPVRIDVRWCRGKQDRVAIEHENIGDMHGKSLGESSIGREVEKLLDNTTAPLRVLITYFRDSAFGTEFMNMKALLEREVESRGKFDFEFLLMAGPWNIAEPQEFVGYVFRPRITAEFIPPHYPS
ncbi:MAG: hypothetical protein JRN06_09135 [Nitrososphaerota archaeon]|nr:hypothetical protein [Nitrososphaerota archaeon]MDG7024749.1 hypothetical protein [Nitrososphaerota archaeon]